MDTSKDIITIIAIVCGILGTLGGAFLGATIQSKSVFSAVEKEMFNIARGKFIERVMPFLGEITDVIANE